MKLSVTQEFAYGCGIACFAFVVGLSYQEATQLLGEEQATSSHFWVKDLVRALNLAGRNYRSNHVSRKNHQLIYRNGSIVLIRRSKTYPSGHYLVRQSRSWMDPWINLSSDKSIANAKSGFRKCLPGSAMYVIWKED